MDYKIELAKYEDLNAIYKLIYDRCLWFSKNGVKGWNIESYPNKYNQEYFKNQMQINKLFILKIGNNICGVMLIKETDSDYWKDNISSYYIHHLATDINKNGIGKLLINFAIEQCKIDNKSRLRLDCYKTSFFLNEYYKKLGFKNVGNGIKEDYEFNLWEMIV